MVRTRGKSLLALVLLLTACDQQESRPERTPALPDGAAVDSVAAAPVIPDSASRPGDDAVPADPPAGAAAPGPAAPAPPAGPAGDTGWTAGVRRGPARGGMATLGAVRAAAQTGYDRVVFEFQGAALPGWKAEYVDRPQHQCGSGNEVRLAGDAWLQVDLEPAQAHDDQGRATVQNRATRPGLPNLLEMRAICDFEGQVSWVLGVRTPGRFRVLQLRDPARLVVDIRH